MKRALIVGIDYYDTAPLESCVSDAQKMFEVLAFNDHLNFPQTNYECKLLTGEYAGQISKAFLLSQIKILLDDPSGKIQSALFYFAGHGYKNDSGSFLVTQDSQEANEGIRMNDIIESCKNSSISEITIILDCCYSGAFGESTLDSSVVEIPRGLNILASSDARQESVERRKGGLFTSLIYQGLQGGAADLLGNITVASLYHYADQLLGAFDQRPVFKTNTSKLEIIRKVEPNLSLDELHQINQIFISPDQQLDLDPSFEPSLNPKNESNEKTFALLQKYRANNLIYPLNEDHLYFAALNKGACVLSSKGKFYWNLIRLNRI